MMLKEGNFQLYSNKQPVMVEVFVCWGDVGVEASDTYLDFSQDRHKQKFLTFEHSNYGGHYVISAE